MSSKLPVVAAGIMLRALKRAGFVLIRTRGSHFFLAHKDGRKTSVPVHAGTTIKPGTLKGILEDINWSNDELRRRL